MKKYLIFILLFILLCNIAKSQGDKSYFYNAIDYCNCKLASAYCQNYASAHKGKKEEASYKLIQGQLNCKIEKPISYDSLTGLLKRNNFKSYADNSAPEFKQLKGLSPESLTKEQAIKEIIDNIFGNQKLSKVVLQTDFINQKDALISELGNYFDGKFRNESPSRNVTTAIDNKIEEKSSTVTNEELQSQIGSLKEEIENNSQHWYSPNWATIIICIVLIMVLFYFFGGKIAELKDRVDRYRMETKTTGSSKSTDWNQTQSTSNNSREWAEFKKEIERKIGDMNDAISRMQDKTFLMESKNIQKQEIKSNNLKEEQEKIFYASIPSKDSSFSNSSISDDINPTESFYKFTLKDLNKAHFEFLNDERAAKNASSSPELILYPVCKIKNSPSQNVKRIKTIVPGVVIKRNDKWEMETPAYIEYE